MRALVAIVVLAGLSLPSCVIDTVPLPDGTREDNAGGGGFGGTDMGAGGTFGSPSGDPDLEAPVITDVTGNGSAHPSRGRHIGDGIIVDGERLDTVTARLGDTELTILDSSPTTLELALPSEVMAGLHTLTLTNDAGEAQANLDLSAGVAGSTQGCP